MMRILVITPYFYPHVGGSERYIEELYSVLAKLNPGLNVDILTYNTEKVAKIENYRGMTIYRLGCVEILRGQFALPNYLELLILLKKIKAKYYKIVNAHTRFFDTAWWGWLAAKYLGASSILTDHCAYHPVHKLSWVSRITKLVDKITIPLLGKTYDLVTVVSKATKTFWQEQGIKREIEVVYGGVDQKLYKNHKKHQKINIVFLGRMIKTKGPQLLLAAAQKIVIEYPNTNFLFAGTGDLLATLQQKKQAKIQFLGNLNRKRVLDLLTKTDILVAPSSHHEGLPSVLLEAGAAACAVITTNRGGVGELIKHEQTGLLAEPKTEAIEEALTRLIIDKKLRKKLGNNLKTLVEEKFDWKKIAKAYRDLIVGLNK